jgi:hypothetical protein
VVIIGSHSWLVLLYWSLVIKEEILSRDCPCFRVFFFFLVLALEDVRWTLTSFLRISRNSEDLREDFEFLRAFELFGLGSLLREEALRENARALVRCEISGLC